MLQIYEQSIMNKIVIAQLLSKDGLHDRALKVDRDIVKERPLDAGHRYNLVCSLTTNEFYDEAIQELEVALNLGFNNIKLLDEDEDLKPLHESPKFQKLMEEAKNGKFREGFFDINEEERIYYGFMSGSLFGGTGVALGLAKSSQGFAAKSKEELLEKIEEVTTTFNNKVKGKLDEVLGFDCLEQIGPNLFVIKTENQNPEKILNTIQTTMQKQGFYLGDFSQPAYEPTNVNNQKRKQDAEQILKEFRTQQQRGLTP
jgi:hypothetical protein